MADYHVLTGSRDGNSYQVVAHFPVPNVNNQAGVNYRTAIIQWLGGAQPSQCPFVTQAEQDQLNAGALLEQVYTFYTRPTETLQQKAARLATLYNQQSALVSSELGALLAYWGLGVDVEE